MFESLIASGPQDHIRARQYILSAAFHFALVVGAVGLTAHPGTTTRVQRDRLKILFVAPSSGDQRPRLRVTACRIISSPLPHGNRMSRCRPWSRRRCRPAYQP
jgi:hypothetical protein